MPSALVTMFNIAPWGGLHENIWYSCTGLAARGWDITVACRAGQLVDKLRDDGVGVHVIEDWDDWSGDARTLSSRHWDVIHSHPFASRKLALAVSANTGAPMLATFHGKNVDDLRTWGEAVHTLVAVSRSHAEMLVTVGGADPDRIVVLPNAVRDRLLSQAVIPRETRLADGEARVVVASRLDADKRALLECVDAITDAARSDDGRRWVVQILGGGGNRDEMAVFLDRQGDKGAHIRVEYLGWVDSEQVHEHLRGAFVAVASGRGAVQSLAVGTPVVAFGSQGVYGLQYGSNLDNGLWGNFGGHPLGNRETTDVTVDTQRLIADPLLYEAVQAAGRIAVRTHLLQSAADDRLDALYRQVSDCTPVES